MQRAAGSGQRAAGSGQRVDEEVPRLCSQPLRVDVQCRDHIRKLEEDAFGGGHDVQDGTQQMAPTSADVGNVPNRPKP